MKKNERYLPIPYPYLDPVWDELDTLPIRHTPIPEDETAWLSQSLERFQDRAYKFDWRHV